MHESWLCGAWLCESRLCGGIRHDWVRLDLCDSWLCTCVRHDCSVFSACVFITCVSSSGRSDKSLGLIYFKTVRLFPLWRLGINLFFQCCLSLRYFCRHIVSCRHFVCFWTICWQGDFQVSAYSPPSPYSPRFMLKSWPYINSCFCVKRDHSKRLGAIHKICCSKGEGVFKFVTVVLHGEGEWSLFQTLRNIVKI